MAIEGFGVIIKAQNVELYDVHDQSTNNEHPTLWQPDPGHEITSKVEELRASSSHIEFRLRQSLDRLGVESSAPEAIYGAAVTQQPAPPDTVYDGHFIGPNGQNFDPKTFPPGTPLSQIPGVLPSTTTVTSNYPNTDRNGNPILDKDGNPIRQIPPSTVPRNNETILYVNGLWTEKAWQQDDIQRIANATGSRVIGIHNSTEGNADIAQAIRDRLDIGNNPPVNTLRDAIYTELKAGRPVHIIGESQGAIIASRALQDAKDMLVAETMRNKGVSRAEAQFQVENLMWDKVKVETFGGAAESYPDGPQYVHYINKHDVVPALLGTDKVRGGRGAAIVTIDVDLGLPGKGPVRSQKPEETQRQIILDHLFDKVYLPNRIPFDQARRLFAPPYTPPPRPNPGTEPAPTPTSGTLTSQPTPNPGTAPTPNPTPNPTPAPTPGTGPV